MLFNNNLFFPSFFIIVTTSSSISSSSSIMMLVYFAAVMLTLEEGKSIPGLPQSFSAALPVACTLLNVAVLSRLTRMSAPCARRPRCEETTARPSCDRKLADVKKPGRTNSGCSRSR